MAGDWIKMRADLHTHPKVVRISSALKADRLRVIGGLHAVWCLFDVHSEDGKLDGYSPEALDDLIGWPGFANAMMAVGWMEQAADSLVTPRFSEHNGQSAKRRAQETERKRLSREMSAPDADKKRTREEKRREDIKTPRKKACAVSLPEDFSLTPELLEWAKEKGYSNLPARLEHFVGYAKANGKKYADWNQAFQNAVRDDWAKLNGKATPASIFEGAE